MPQRAARAGLMLPLAGAYFADDGTQPDRAALAGRVHLVVRVDLLSPNPILPPSPFRVHADLAGVSGVGRASGAPHSAAGAQLYGRAEFDPLRETGRSLNLIK